MTDNGRARMGLLLAGLASFSLMGFGQALFGPTLPEATRLFQLPEGRSGMLVSAQWIGSAVGVGLMFLWGARITPRYALAFLTLGAAGIAAHPTWWAMLLAAMVFGAGYGMATAVFNPRVLRSFGDRGASMLSLLNAAFAAGAIVSPLVFVWLGSASQLAFGLTAVMSVVLFVFVAERNGASVEATAPTRSGFRPSWPVLAFGAVSVGIEACLIGLGPTALIAAGESEPRAAQLLSAFFVVFLLSRIVLGFMAHRVPSFLLYLTAMAWTAASAMAAVLWSPGVAFVALGLSAGIFFPSFYVTASRKMGEDSRVPPVILAAGLVGGIGLPIVVSLLTAGLGDRGFFWLLFGIALPTAALALFMQRGMNR